MQFENYLNIGIILFLRAQVNLRKFCSKTALSNISLIFYESSDTYYKFKINKDLISDKSNTGICCYG